MHDKWKVLIADDEPIIREGIRDSVNWESLDLVIAAEAEDGEEALELALEHSIDILLVDLNMPIMDGITLMKALKEKLPECKFIIITGHDEFSYAQEAIRLDVNDYILKPVNPEQLQQVLSNVREQLYASKQQKEHLSLASRQIKKNFPVLRERFGLEWIGGELSAEEIMEQLRFLNLPERCPDVLGVIRWPDLQVGPPINSEQDRQLFLFAIENIVSEMLSSWEIMLFRDPSVLIIVCVWGDVPNEVWTRMEQNIHDYLNITVSQHFIRLTDDVMQVPDAYREAKNKVYQDSVLSPLVRRGRQYIQRHYADPELTLEKLASVLRVSPVHLSRSFKQELGISFIALLTQTRMNKAMELLSNSELTINEIAERVGYNTQHYFSTSFKKWIGVSPNQYRRGESISETTE